MSSPSRSCGCELKNPASDAAEEMVPVMLPSPLILSISSLLTLGLRRFTTRCFLFRPGLPCLPDPRVRPVAAEP